MTALDGINIIPQLIIPFIIIIIIIVIKEIIKIHLHIYFSKSNQEVTLRDKILHI